MKSLILSLVTAFAIASPIAQAETIFGLTTNDVLIRFDSATPGQFTSVPITGLPPNEFLLAIDFRPVAAPIRRQRHPTASWYACSCSTHHLYTFKPPMACADRWFRVPPLQWAARHLALISIPLPTACIVNEVDESFRLDPNTATVVAYDIPLAFTAGDPNIGANPNVIGAAYTNNFGGETQTTLYGIDFGLDALVRQGGVNGIPSPNTGELRPSAL